MSAVRLERIGPCRFKVFIDGHEVTHVCSLDTSQLVRLDGLPELTMTFNPDSFVIEPLEPSP